MRISTFLLVTSLGAIFSLHGSGLPLLCQTESVVAQYSHENKAVLQACSEFLRHIQEAKLEDARLIEALKFAALKHKDQTRKDLGATPYIIHPIGVADTLLTLGQESDVEVLIAALLHDTVEDTNTTWEEIRSAFGPTVEGYVREVTDDKSLPKQERKELQIIHAPHKSKGAAEIKLADKLYNLKDLLHSPPPDWEKERVSAYFNWAEKVVSALPSANPHLLQAVEEVISEYRAL